MKTTESDFGPRSSPKLSKQANQEQNHRYDGDYLEGYQLGGGSERMGEKVQGLRNTNW